MIEMRRFLYHSHFCLESGALREPRRHPGEPRHHAGHGQDRARRVRLHGRGPDGLLPPDGQRHRRPRRGRFRRRHQRHRPISGMLSFISFRIIIVLNNSFLFLHILQFDLYCLQPTGTNIVTNTAPTPGVRMRVVRDGGETASMVGLGEDLSLRIEIDQVRRMVDK